MGRKFFISVALLFAALGLADCQREPAVQPVTEADKTIPSYHVPREKAIAELNSFLADVDANNVTRGGKIRQIKDGVIDGYIKRQRDNQIETMMHCNMGWGGECDGYYVSGLFDTTQVKDAQGNPTDGDAPENKHHYCKRYRMVLYDKPRILP